MLIWCFSLLETWMHFLQLDSIYKYINNKNCMCF